MAEAPLRAGRPLRAQAHDAPRAGDDRGDRRRASTWRRWTRRAPGRARAQRHRRACACAPRAPLLADPYARNRGVGRVHPRRRDDVRDGRRGHDLHRLRGGRPARRPAQPGRRLARARRCRGATAGGVLGVRGATIWLTGLPGAGKSTIGEELERRLIAAGRPAYLLDGENLRHGLSADLGFSDADRHEHARRAANVASILADTGNVAIVALVSPMAADRAYARELHEQADLRLRRGLGRHAAGGMRAARPGRPLPPRLGGRADRLHGRRRALRGARPARRAPARRRRAGRALGRAPARGARPELAPSGGGCCPSTRRRTSWRWRSPCRCRSSTRSSSRTSGRSARRRRS